MNCAIHTDAPATAYCRTCGKPMCDTCKRDIQGVLYCESCLAAHLQGTTPSVAPGAATVTPGQGVVTQPRPSGGANPVLAGFLGAIPFGVGAVYNGQYVKGLIHLIIFGFLCWGSDNVGGGMDTLFGLGIAFFVIYQIVDAVRTAKARQLGQPIPDDLLGLNRLSPAAPGAAPATGGTAPGCCETAENRPPVGAIVLVGLGVLFLLANAGWFSFHWLNKLWPLALIAAGIWVIYKRQYAGRGESR